MGSLKYRSTKTYGHDVGLSACFRQWRADSHCRFLHGYSLSVKLTFETETLDARNWCQDFGGLKQVKRYLEDKFDHKTLVAYDDPELNTFLEMEKKGLIQLREVPSTGCEKFAEMIFNYVDAAIELSPGVQLIEVEVKEHGANGASYVRQD